MAEPAYFWDLSASRLTAGVVQIIPGEKRLVPFNLARTPEIARGETLSLPATPITILPATGVTITGVAVSGQRVVAFYDAATAGDYTVTLTVNTSGGGVVRGTGVLRVAAPGIPNAAAPYDPSVVVGVLDGYVEKETTAPDVAVTYFTGKGGDVVSVAAPASVDDATFRNFELFVSVNTAVNRSGEPDNPVTFLGYLPTDVPYVYDCWEQAYRPPSPSADIWAERWWAYGDGAGHEQRVMYSRYESDSRVIVAAYTTDLFQLIYHNAGGATSTRQSTDVDGTIFSGRVVVNALAGAVSSPLQVYNSSAQLLAAVSLAGPVFGGTATFRDLTNVRQSMLFEQNASSSAATYAAGHADFFSGNNQIVSYQRNAANNGWLALPFYDDSNRIEVGRSLATGVRPTARIGTIQQDAGAAIGWNGKSSVNPDGPWTLSGVSTTRTFNAASADLAATRNVLGTLLTFLLARGDLTDV